MLKVAYEISALGQGYKYSRTGIFRTVENITSSLLNSGECHLAFCVTDSFAHLSYTLEYLATNREFGAVPFLSSPVEQHIHRPLAARLIPPDKWSQIGRFSQLLQKVRWKALSLVESRATCLDSRVIEGKDIFHSTLAPLPNFEGKARSLKRFLTVYDLIPIFHPQYFTANPEAKFKIEQACLSLSPEDWVLCISQASKNDLCEFRPDLDPDQMVVTHLAASHHFQPTSTAATAAARARYQIPDAPYILSLCTLEPRKNIDHLIRCFAEVVSQQRIQDLNLVLVGSKGWDYDKIYNEILHTHDIADRIIITGYVSDQDIAAVYSGALAFAYPSLYEGFGLPPLEAMQCGVPVITSNVSSLPEVVGAAGIMVDPKDADQLCDWLLKIYTDSALRSRLAQLSLTQAEKFSWENCARQTLDAYKQALKN